MIGSWSIGRCYGWDSCKCNNGAEKAAVGVATVPKRWGSLEAVFVCEDTDYYYWETGYDGFCDPSGMENGSNGAGDYGDLIDLSVLGTTPLTGISFALTNEPAFHCPSPPPWHGEPTGAAQAYVHVYEVNLEASPLGNGASIDWSITEFSGTVSGDVTPNHMRIKVSDTISNRDWVSDPFAGWSGSETWDGSWTEGENWDGCAQVKISLEVAPDPPANAGVSSIYVSDETCGVWAYRNEPIDTEILFPKDDECECGDEEPSLSGCPGTWKKTCKTDDSTETYNCYAWSVNRTDVWVMPAYPNPNEYPPDSEHLVVDYEYGGENGYATQCEWDAFYAAHGLVPTDDCTEACAGWSVVHAYNLCSCAPLWESKCGDGERGTHGVHPLLGNYGWPTHFYKPSSD